MEESVGDIVTEMEYLKGREMRLRDTNESTNERVKWFALWDHGRARCPGCVAGGLPPGILQASLSPVSAATLTLVQVKAPNLDACIGYGEVNHCLDD